MSSVLLTEAQQKKKNKGLCITPYCTKRHAKNRNVCYSCKIEKFKILHPLHHTYNTWILNCRRRKKVNTVTFEQFCAFAEKNDYMRKKGTGAKKFQIDREKECTPECPKEWCEIHGYHNHNIQAITLRENVQKYYRLVGSSQYNN
jgi:hypothetical protein